MSYTSYALAIQQVQKFLYVSIQEIEKKRQSVEQNITSLIKFQLTSDHKGQNYQQQLKVLLENCLSQTESEKKLLKRALQRIANIRNIKNEYRIQIKQSGHKEFMRRGPWLRMVFNSAQTLPLYVGKIDEKPPPLCGAIPPNPGYIANIGDMVAALVRLLKDEDMWILAEVVSYNHSTNKYEIDDILVDKNQKSRYIVSKTNVIPLPLMRANPETNPSALYAERTTVMALYPACSSFYEGIVNKPPATLTDEYEILFVDNKYPNNYSPPCYVCQRYVIPKKNKKQL